MARLAAVALLSCFALGWAAPADAAKVNKCTRADGTVYYSGQPCPSTDKSDTVRVQRPAESATDEDAATDRKSLDERIAEADDPIRKAQLEVQKKQCDIARNQLERYEDAPYLVEKKDDGSERRLSDEETAAEKARLQTLLQEQC